MGSNSIQQVNKKKAPGKSSQYFGVTWSEQKQKWYAKYTVNYQTKNVGLFEKEIDAAVAVIKALVKQWGSNVRIEDQKKLGLFPV
jgi:hypothetical protein